MAQGSSLNALMVIFVLATLSMAAAHVSAQSSDMAPAPAPSMVTGAGFSLLVSSAVLGFSLIFSLVSILKH
ncbi:hypothetical protein ACOSP7_026925 [Xanthoceras sorbifolium]